ncbi:TonB-dependent receptor [Portibacter marinus]|uniref:TonB-dependent receptor n=1 Tax=Portibacter marinus TaxID=2898660 RepID=UPI001F408A27|nr:TonB-dependent receptor [Portibacter marinus]
MVRYLIAILLYSAGLVSVTGQVVVSGIVVDKFTKEPLIGANVVVSGTSSGTVTDWDGTFTFTTEERLPFVVEASYLGYELSSQEVSNQEDRLTFELGEASVIVEGIEVKGQRISDKQKAAPLTVESLDIIGIKQTASSNFYDGLGALKDVDLTTASLGFTIINTRGFNSTSPVRSLQIIDGVDNQSPGLNFSLGNFLGASELDINKVDLIVGASSAFYGPNAFNGVISMTTKDPFINRGLAAKVKVGERSMINPSFRFADAIRNKEGDFSFAYKLNFFYLQANDWQADNYDPVFDTRTGVDNPGRFDAVNIYGDEYQSTYDLSKSLANPGLGIFHRTGYREVDLVDYGTKNLKANASLHFRLKPKQDFESPELVIASNYGGGTTVYQGDNRFSLKNIRFYQHKAELKKRDKYFLRFYATHEDSGDSYDPYFTALKLQQRAASNRDWGSSYVSYWNTTANPIIKSQEGFPKVSSFVGNPEGYRAALAEFFSNNPGLLEGLHQQAEASANVGVDFKETNDFLIPGSSEFENAFNDITGRIANSEGGTKFFDKSALTHLHGEYKFNDVYQGGGILSGIDLLIGGNGRYYLPNSRGSILLDTMGRNIDTYEYGVYGGGTVSFNESKLKLNISTRLDKHQNFDFLFSPAASLVYNPRPNTFLRLSFSSAVRNPTLTDQYLFYNVGRAILLGNITGVQGLIDVESFRDYLNAQDINRLQYFDVDPIRPERVRTLEGGLRTTLFEKVYVDATYYFSRYRDFIGYQIGLDAEFDNFLNNPTRVQAFRVSANAQDIVTTQGFSVALSYYFAKYFLISGNYSWNKLNTASDDPIIPAFNTPENKYNISLSGRDMIVDVGGLRIKNVGFNVQYKWIEGFLFEGSPQFTGFIPTYSLLDGQINWNWKNRNLTFKLGASNILNTMNFQTYGGPRIGRMAYFSVLYDWNNKN